MAYQIEIEIFEDMGCAWARCGKYKVVTRNSVLAYLTTATMPISIA